MTEDSRRTDPVANAYYVQHTYAPWAPSGMLRDTRTAGTASLVLGALALVLAVTSTLRPVAWIAAVVGISIGLLAWLLPRGTGSQKLMSGIGAGAALTAAVLMLA